MISRNRKLSALAITLALPVLILAGLIAGAEQPFTRAPERPLASRRAAIAIRDDVIPFQKWGTRVFTVPYLERYYDATSYFTESSDSDTRQAFIAALTQALNQYDSVDLFLLAHSNLYIDWVATIDPGLRRKIRLVYNTGCYDAAQAQGWLTLGAQTAIAHPGSSNSPVFYFYFLRRWTLGMSIDQAVAESNDHMRGTFELTSVGTLGQFDTAERFEQSQALCFGNCRITIGD